MITLSRIVLYTPYRMRSTPAYFSHKTMPGVRRTQAVFFEAVRSADTKKVQEILKEAERSKIPIRPDLLECAIFYVAVQKRGAFDDEAFERVEGWNSVFQQQFLERACAFRAIESLLKKAQS